MQFGDLMQKHAPKNFKCRNLPIDIDNLALENLCLRPYMGVLTTVAQIKIFLRTILHFPYCSLSTERPPCPFSIPVPTIRNKAGYGIRAVSFADIPTENYDMKRQKPRSAARMSENTVPRLIAALRISGQTKRLTTAPVMQVANVPAARALMPSDTTSVLRSGTMLPSPPINIPRLPKFAKLHRA